MIGRVNCSCQVRPSNLGAKGFYYMDERSSFLLVKKDSPVEILNFVAPQDHADWRAVVIDNQLVEGSALDTGRSVYWILKKNLS